MSRRPNLSASERVARGIVWAIVFAMIGALASYAFAWRFHVPGVEMLSLRGARFVPQPGHWSDASPYWDVPLVYTCTNIGVDAALWESDSVRGDGRRYARHTQSGFPFRCVAARVSWEFWSSGSPIGYVTPERIDEEFRLPDGRGVGIRVPWRPLWPGLVANSAIYGVLAFGLFVVLRRILRRFDPRPWLRRRRGLCGECGYNRRGVPSGAACPECGLD